MQRLNSVNPKAAEGRGWRTEVTPELKAFLAGLDMFYLGTANAEGQPYIQYRGGASGWTRPARPGIDCGAFFSLGAMEVKTSLILRLSSPKPASAFAHQIRNRRCAPTAPGAACRR